jgi:hypothetical protein
VETGFLLSCRRVSCEWAETPGRYRQPSPNLARHKPVTDIVGLLDQPAFDTPSRPARPLVVTPPTVSADSRDAPTHMHAFVHLGVLWAGG